MPRNRSLARKLCAYILCGAALVFLVVFIYNYSVSRSILIKNLEENAEIRALVTANRLEQIFIKAQEIGDYTATLLETREFAGARLHQLLREVLKRNPEINSLCVAYEPNAFRPGLERFAPFYVNRDGDVQFNGVVQSKAYNYFYWDWYQLPRELKRPVWTEPYFGPGGGVVMTSYCVPFRYPGEGADKDKIRGVVDVDISLSWLRQQVDAVKPLKSGYGFLVSRFGRIVTHPDVSLIMNQSLFTLAEEKNNPALATLGRRMIKGEKGFEPYQSVIDHRDGWVFYAPIPACQWSLAVFFPKDELLSDLRHLSLNIGLIAVGGFVLLGALIMILVRRGVAPLRLLAEASERIGSGDFQAPLPPVARRDEVGQLTSAFENMKGALATYMENLKITTAEKERVESELSVAKEIQLSIIPKLFPAFPERPEIDIYASLESARAVGGDLYDFFFLEEDLLCFTLGDVSGKGVPASLFMAVTQTLFRAKAAKNMEPQDIVNAVNKALCADNDQCMFVTFFMGIIDVKTGRARYVNAGHNPPYILRRGGALEKLDATHGVPLGIFDMDPYGSGDLTLAPGDSLVIYTDGVTEAMNRDNDLFEESRLEQVLRESRGVKSKAITQNIRAAVKDFVAGHEQSDDITILCLTFHGDPSLESDHEQPALL